MFFFFLCVFRILPSIWRSSQLGDFLLSAKLKTKGLEKGALSPSSALTVTGLRSLVQMKASFSVRVGKLSLTSSRRTWSDCSENFSGFSLNKKKQNKWARVQKATWTWTFSNFYSILTLFKDSQGDFKILQFLSVKLFLGLDLPWGRIDLQPAFRVTIQLKPEDSTNKDLKSWSEMNLKLLIFFF